LQKKEEKAEDEVVELPIQDEIPLTSMEPETKPKPSRNQLMREHLRRVKGWPTF
jgi:hypothetical protein